MDSKKTIAKARSALQLKLGYTVTDKVLETEFKLSVRCHTQLHPWTNCALLQKMHVSTFLGWELPVFLKVRVSSNSVPTFEI